MSVKSDQSEKLFRFNNVYDDYYRLHMIGYNDFRYMEGCKYYRIHAVDTLHFVQRGCGHLFIADAEYTIKAGDYFYIEKNIPVLYYPDEEDPWSYYWIDIRNDSRFKLGDYFGLKSVCPVRHATQPDAVEAVLDALFRSDLSKTSLYFATLSSVFRILSIEDTANAGLRKIDTLDSIVQQVKDCIASNYTYKFLQLQDIADMLYISSRHMRRAFVEKVGMTPIAYLATYRLNVAYHLLTLRDYKVDELCEAVGWRDKLYFMKCFKRQYHMTVREFRTSVKEYNRIHE